MPKIITPSNNRYLQKDPRQYISRIFYFTPIKNTFILLHGFVKKTSKRELDTTMRYMEYYKRRSKNE